MNRFLIVTIVSIFLSSCSSDCDSEMRVRGDQFLDDQISGEITSQDYRDEVSFINANGEIYEFTKFTHRKFIEKDFFNNQIECEEGNLFTPYLNREVFELGYASEDRDTIMMRIVSYANYAILSSADLMPDDNTQLGIDRMFIYLSFQGCPIENSFRNMVNPLRESQVRETPFTITKFDQEYHDIYGIQSSWSNGVILSYSNGIVGFNFCGKDYAQVVE